MIGKSKYGAKLTVVDGITFASKREAIRYAILKQKERVGMISKLELQPRFPIVIDCSQVRYPNTNRPLSYVADFSYIENGARVIEDVKGMDTPLSKFKRAIVEHIYRIKIEIVK